MTIFFLEKLRKILKSVGKIEFKIIDKLILLNNYNKKNSTSYFIKEENFNNLDNKLIKRENHPGKLVIVICFFFNSKKLKMLDKTLSQVSLFKFKKDVTILTNKITKSEKKILKKTINKKIKKFSLCEIKDMPDDNLLPWYSLNIMREKYKDNKNSHFMFLEDDILVNSKNISYWIYFRKILKKYGLIPGFLRYEKYKNKFFSIDNPKKIIIEKFPNITTSNKKYGFVNSKFPYQGMYLMDRELMKKYLVSNAVKIDYSFTNRIMRSLYPIKELANISYAYLNTPIGYHNCIMLPFNENKQIPRYSLIEHCDVKYVKLKEFNKMGYGTIEVDKLLS